MNEMARLFPDELAYYELGLRNVSANFDVLAPSGSANPARLEQLMATFELYRRAIKNGIPLPDDFDVDRFLDILESRAKANMRAYLWPERAIYSASCDEITGAFHSYRENTWEIRIDTVQHNIGGYYMLRKGVGFICCRNNIPCPTRSVPRAFEARGTFFAMLYGIAEAPARGRKPKGHRIHGPCP